MEVSNQENSAEDDGSKGEGPPVLHAERGSPLNGVVPPPEHRWKPGQSGNPSGRPSAGASINEWINQFVLQDTSVPELRRIAGDDAMPPKKRMAANRIIFACERGDLADFTALIDEGKSLKEIRESGINTEVVKKLRVTRRSIPEDAGGGEEVKTEIELHDRSGAEFDRIVNHTDGTPTQTMDIKSDVSIDVQNDLSDYMRKRLADRAGQHGVENGT